MHEGFACCVCQTLNSLSLQRQKETPRGEDRQHLTEAPADETETERVREEPREVAALEARSAVRRRGGSRGHWPAGVLDVFPVKRLGRKTDSYFAPIPGLRYFSE